MSGTPPPQAMAAPSATRPPTTATTTADDGWSSPSAAVPRRRDRHAAHATQVQTTTRARSVSPHPNPQQPNSAPPIANGIISSDVPPPTEAATNGGVKVPASASWASEVSTTSNISMSAGSPPKESAEAHIAKMNQSRMPTPSPGDPRSLFPSSFTVQPTHHSPYSHRSSLITHPSIPLTFLVLDCPSDATLPDYVSILKDNGVKDVVRICEEGVYDKRNMEREGITVWDTMKFEDGGVPSDAVVNKWHDLVSSLLSQPRPPQRGVATHCVSGIGRAPLFVAISLIDAGLDPLDAIEVVRKRRRGAFNKRQVDWLVDGYRPKRGIGTGGGGSTKAVKKDDGRTASSTSSSNAGSSSGGGGGGGLFGLFKKKGK